LLKAKPPVGSRAKPLVRGQGRSPLKLKTVFHNANEAQICPFCYAKYTFWKNIVAFLYGIILLVVIYTVTKSGGLRRLKALKFNKKPS